MRLAVHVKEVECGCVTSGEEKLGSGVTVVVAECRVGQSCRASPPNGSFPAVDGGQHGAWRSRTEDGTVR